MANTKNKIVSKKTGKPEQQKVKRKAENNSKNKLFIPFIIFIFSFCIYANSINNKYALDDDIICMKNSYVQSHLSNIKEIFTKGDTYTFNGAKTDTYRPITILSIALEVFFYGNKPHRHHFINVLLFSLSCVVLYLLLRKIFINYNFILPLIITLLFAAHPIHTEVVANIKSRDEIFCFLFFVLSLYYMMIYFEKKNIYKLITSCILYFLSLMSKENAITFFIIFPMVIFYFTKTNLKKSILFATPYLAIMLIFLAIRYSVIDTVAFNSKINIVNNSLMATGSYTDRLATAFSMFGKYLQLLIFPITLSCDYSYNSIPIVSWINPKAFLSFIIFIGALIYAAIKLPKKNYFSFAILFFITTFITTSNFLILINCSMAERFIFTPSLGFCIIIGLALVKIFKVDIIGNNKKGLFPVYFILILTIFLYSFKTINRNNDWQDNEHLFAADVKNMPNSFRLHFAVGSSIREKGEKERDQTIKNDLLTKAITEYKQSINILSEQGETWYNMGVCYYELNDMLNAKKAYKQCIEITPNFNAVYNNLGVIFYNANNYDSAYYYFNKSLQKDPNNADAITNIGAIMQNKGKYDEAIKYYEQSLVLNPNNVNTYHNLIIIYSDKNDKAKVDYYKNKLKSIN